MRGKFRRRGCPPGLRRGRNVSRVEVVDLAKQVAGYEGADAHEAVDALPEARATARKEKELGRGRRRARRFDGLSLTIETLRGRGATPEA